MLAGSIYHFALLSWPVLVGVVVVFVWFVWFLLLFVLLLFGSFDLIGIVMTPLDCVSGPSLARLSSLPQD